MRANAHFYVMITQFVLSIYFIFSLIHSFDIQIYLVSCLTEPVCVP